MKPLHLTSDLPAVIQIGCSCSRCLERSSVCRFRARGVCRCRRHPGLRRKRISASGTSEVINHSKMRESASAPIKLIQIYRGSGIGNKPVTMGSCVPCGEMRLVWFLAKWYPKKALSEIVHERCVDFVPELFWVGFHLEVRFGFISTWISDVECFLPVKIWKYKKNEKSEFFTLCFPMKYLSSMSSKAEVTF